MAARGKYPCGYCGERFATAVECREHSQGCPELKRRLDDLPGFIAAKVYSGGLKLAAAEREAEEFWKENPPIRLD